MTGDDCDSVDPLHRRDFSQKGARVDVEDVYLVAMGHVEAAHVGVHPEVVVADVARYGVVGEDLEFGGGGRSSG